jgi:hypothetical protein
MDPQMNLNRPLSNLLPYRGCLHETSSVPHCKQCIEVLAELAATAFTVRREQECERAGGADAKLSTAELRELEARLDLLIAKSSRM